MCSVARGRTSGRVIRSASASARKRVEVAVGQLADAIPGRRGAADDLVVDVGDVHHPADRVAAPAQVADEQVGEQERAEVADVGRAVDRRPARVDADDVVAERHERPGLAARVSCRRTRHGEPRCVASGERADRPPGALGAVQVAGRRLDADRLGRRGRAASAIASRIASSRSPRRGRAATIVRSTDRGRQPAVRRAARPTLGEHRAAGDARRRRRHPPGRGARGRPGRPRRAGASATAWRATSPSRVAVQPRRAVEGRRRRAAAARPDRTGGCPGRCPCASAGWPAPRRGRARPRSAGTVTLRLVGSPGTTWTGILQASSSAASSVQSRRSPGGGPAERPRAASPARTPCGVWARPSAARSTVADDPSPSTRLSVSATGRTGIAAPCSTAARDDRGRRGRPGRAGARRRGRGRPDRRRIGHRAARAPRSPPRTESCRRSPPATTVTHRRGQPRPRPRARPTRSAPVTTTTCSTSGAAPRSPRASGEQRPAGDRSASLSIAVHPARARRRRRR